MPQDFDALFNQYMNELNSLGSAPQQEQAPFDAEAYLASLGIKKRSNVSKSLIGDIPRKLAQGVDLMGIAGGQALDFLGADALGQKVKDIYTQSYQQTQQELTPETQAAPPIYDPDKGWSFSPRSVVAGAAESLPAMLAGGGFGGALGKAALGFGLGRTAATVATAGGASLGEGLQSGLGSAAGIKQEMLEKGFSVEEADAAAQEAALKVGGATTGIGLLTGGGAAGALARRGVLPQKAISTPLTQDVLKGIGTEAGQEFLQSGAEQYLGDAVRKEYIDPTIDPTKYVLSASIQGAAIGGLTGGAFGAAGYGVSKLREETQPSANPVVDNQTTTDLLNAGPVPLQDTLHTVEPSVGQAPTQETTAVLSSLLAKVNKKQPVVTEPEIGDTTGTDVKPVITLPQNSVIANMAALVDSANGTDFRKQFKNTKQGVLVPSSVIKELNEYLQDPKFAGMKGTKAVADLVTEQALQEEAAQAAPVVETPVEEVVVPDGVIFPAGVQEGAVAPEPTDLGVTDDKTDEQGVPSQEQGRRAAEQAESVQKAGPETVAAGGVFQTNEGQRTTSPTPEEKVIVTEDGQTFIRRPAVKKEQGSATPQAKPTVQPDYTALSDEELGAAFDTSPDKKVKGVIAEEQAYRRAKAALFEQAKKTNENDKIQVGDLVATVDFFNRQYTNRLKKEMVDYDRIDTITNNARDQYNILNVTPPVQRTTQKSATAPVVKKSAIDTVLKAAENPGSDKVALARQVRDMLINTKARAVNPDLIQERIDEIEDYLGDGTYSQDEIWEVAKEAAEASRSDIEATPRRAAKAKSGTTELNKVVRNAKDTKATLDTIAKTHKNKVVSSIAGLLRDMNLNVETKIVKDLKDDDGDAAIGLYSKGIVELDADSFNDTDMSAIYVHEVIHRAINNKLSNKNFAIYKTRLNQLKSEIRKQLTKKGLDPDLFYGVREGVHIEELITEAFTNEDLQLALESVKLPEPKSKYIKTLLDKFVDVVRQILGFKQEQHNALKEVIALGLETIEPTTLKGRESLYKKAAKTDDFSARQKLDYMLETTKQGKNLLDGLVKTFESNFPNADKFFTYMFRNPLWLAEKMRTEGDEAAEYMVRGVENREKRTEDFNDLKEDFLGSAEGKPALKTIAEKFEAMDSDSQFKFLNLVHVSDMNNVKYNTIQEAMQAKTQDGTVLFRRDKPVTKEVFDLYNEVHAYSKGLFLQSFNTSRNLALAKLNKSVAKKMEKLLKLETWLEEDADFKREARAILDKEGLSSEIVTEALEDVLSTRGALKRLRDTFTERQFYMPRIRKPGPYKLQVFEKTKDGKRGKEVYSASFASDAIREAVKTNLSPVSPEMGLNAGLRDLEFVESYNTKGAQVDPGGFNIIATDSFLDDVMNRAQRMGDLSDKEAKAVRKAMAQHTAETILAMSGSGKHKIKRMEDYVVGFETNPIQAFLTYSESLANSYAKARYVQAQIEAYGEIKKVNPKASEYFLDYMKTTTAPRTGFDEISSKVRYAATLYFMGGSISSAIINLSQNPILGIPTLIKLGATGPKATKTLGKYFKMVAPQVTKDMMNRIRLSGDMLSLSSHVQASPKGLPTGLDTILQWYRKSGLNLDTQTSVAMGADEGRLSDKLASRFQTIADKLMAPFKAVEVANRESTLLAAADILAAKQGINLMEATEEQLESLYAEGKRVVNQVHFMSSGNLPMYAQKHPTMRTMLAMQSYGINFLNIIYNSLSSGDKKEYAHVARIFGMMALVGGAFGAIPFSDEANKILRRMLNMDLKLEAQQEIGKITGEELAHVILHGPFNIANNISLRVPDPFGLVGMLTDGTEAGIYSAGAIGSIANRIVKAMNYASNGQWSKAVGIGSPEAFGRVVRAYQEYNEGFTSAKGAPVYFQGEKLKATLPQALLKGVIGIKTPTETRVAQARITKFDMQQRFNEKRAIAVNEAAKGNMKPMQAFNEERENNEQMRLLTKPIRSLHVIQAKRRKQPKKDKAFEESYG